LTSRWILLAFILAECVLLSPVKGDMPAPPTGSCKLDQPTYFAGQAIVIHVHVDPGSGLYQPYIVENMSEGQRVTMKLGDQLAPGDYTFNLGTASPPPGYVGIALYTIFYQGNPWKIATCGYNIQGQLAEITVSSCWITPSNPQQNDQVTFYAQIGNTGGADASNLEVDAYLDGNMLYSGRETIHAGSSAHWSYPNTWVAQEGSHTLRIIANADHSVPEPNYGKDETSCSFVVASRPLFDHTIVYLIVGGIAIVAAAFLLRNKKHASSGAARPHIDVPWMACPNCNTANPPTAIYCRHCRKPLR